MATEKDLNLNQNPAPDKSAQQDWESHHTSGDRYPEEAKGIAETEVKNAHAAGDGAMEPNDTPLPEMNKNKGKDEDEDPPY